MLSFICKPALPEGTEGEELKELFLKIFGPVQLRDGSRILHNDAY